MCFFFSKIVLFPASSSGSQKVPAKENSTSKHVTFNESQATGIPEANVEIDLKKCVKNSVVFFRFLKALLC